MAEFEHIDDNSECECSECGNEDIDDSDYITESESESESDSDSELDEITEEELIELGREYLEIIAELGYNYRMQ